MSKIPKDMQKKADEADAMLEKMAEDKAPVEVVKPVEEVIPPPVEQPKPEPPVIDNKPLDERIKALEKALEAEVQKRSIDKGRHDKDVEELQQQIEERNKIIEEMDAPPEEQLDAQTLFSEEEQDALDPEYIKMSQKVAEASVKAAVKRNDDVWSKKYNALEKAVEDLRESTQINSNVTFEGNLLARLGMTRESLMELDKSPGFAEYVAKQDGFSRKTIDDSLVAAIAAGDVETSALIYQNYIGSLTKSEPSAGPAETPTRVAGTEVVTESNVTTTLTLDDIAERYVKGEISKEQKDTLQKQLEDKLEAEFQKERF